MIERVQDQETAWRELAFFISLSGVDVETGALDLLKANGWEVSHLDIKGIMPQAVLRDKSGGSVYRKITIERQGTNDSLIVVKCGYESDEGLSLNISLDHNFQALDLYGLKKIEVVAGKVIFSRKNYDRLGASETKLVVGVSDNSIHKEQSFLPLR